MMPGLHRLAACALLTTLTMAQESSPVPPADTDGLAYIEGISLGANHLPLPGTNVFLATDGFPHDALRSATSDLLGKFSFRGLHGGYHFVLTASHNGYSGSAFSGPNMTLAVGQHLTGLTVELVPLTVLSGKVTNENGDPMPDVTVRPMRLNVVVNGHLRVGNAGAGVQTGTNGEYQVTVDSGHWYLSFLPAPAKVHPTPTDSGVSDEPEQGYVTTYYPGVHELAVAADVDATGQPVPELNVRLQKTVVHHVRGKVAGGMLPDLRVVRSQETGNASPSIIDEGQPVHDDGTFDIAGLASGEWNLNLRQYGKLISLGLQIVRLGDSDVDNVVIALQPPGQLSGSIITVPDVPDGRSASLADPIQLNALEPFVSDADAPIRRDGTFTLTNVEAGRYRLDLVPPAGGYVKSVIFDGRECIDSGIDFAGGTRAGLRVTISMTAGTITGSVTNPDGGPPSGAVVTLMPDGLPTSLYRPELHPIVRTDATGHFVAKDVVPGRYRVYAWENLEASVWRFYPAAFADPDFPQLFDNMGAVVTIGDNESRQVSLTMISAAKMNDESRRRR